MRRDDERKEVLDEIKALRKEVGLLRADRDAAKDELGLITEVKSLKTEIADLEINKSKLTEDHEREKREVKHMVGLEKKRQEFEIDQAKRDTTLTVREENLTADRKRFEEQMEFMSSRMEAEVKYLKSIMSEVLQRLPEVTVEKSIELNGNAGPARSKARAS